MPTERFFHLPQEKQDAITGAAFREFAGVTLDKVSINRIIKEADISRGSFYTYFEDKWDLLSYIFESSQQMIEREAARSLQETGGDVWVMFRSIFDSMVECCADPQAKAFISNVLVHANPEFVLRIFPDVEDAVKNEDMERKLRAFYEAYKNEQFRTMPYERFRNFIQMAMLTIIYELRQFAGGVEKERVTDDFNAKMDILRSGVAVTQK